MRNHGYIFACVLSGILASLTTQARADLNGPSPEQSALAPIAEKVLDGKEACCACDNCGSSCWLDPCACTGKPYRLPQPCLLQHLGIQVSGWVEQGITYNATDPADGYNGPVATNDLDSEYQMDQLWMVIERPVNTCGCGWDIGGRIDIMYGTDWRFGINNGLETEINGFNGQTYGMVIPQAYVEVAYNDLSVKLGHYAAILDYEVVAAPPNPLYSHSLCYSFTVPQLVTGALANYQVNDRLSLQGGFHRGWSQFEDNNDHLDLIAGIKWASCDKGTSIAYAVSTGRQGAPRDDQNRFVYSLVVQQQLTCQLRYVLVHNLGIENGLGPDVQDAEWYGLNNYFLYTINPCLTACVRAEWLRDDDGARVAGVGTIPGVSGWNGKGFAGDFYEITAGLKWLPHPNVIVRPEVRWDWYDGELGANDELPYDGGNGDDQFTMAVDAIITF
jgi:hypothetical protein